MNGERKFISAKIKTSQAFIVQGSVKKATQKLSVQAVVAEA